MQPSAQAIENIRIAKRVLSGLEPNVITETSNDLVKVFGNDDHKYADGQAVSVTKFVADPANVQNARYQSGVDKELTLFHYDFIPTILGKHINFIAQYQAERGAVDNLTLYRLFFPEPIMDIGNPGSSMERSVLAMPTNIITDVFVKYFLLQMTFVNRYTKKERDEYETSTGAKLKDTYWEIKKFDMKLRDFTPFTLFLPSGMDFAVTPVIREDGVIVIRKSPPDANVVAHGFKTLTQGHAAL